MNHIYTVSVIVFFFPPIIGMDTKFDSSSGKDGPVILFPHSLEDQTLTTDCVSELIFTGSLPAQSACFIIFFIVDISGENKAGLRTLPLFVGLHHSWTQLIARPDSLVITRCPFEGAEEAGFMK